MCSDQLCGSTVHFFNVTGIKYRPGDEPRAPLVKRIAELRVDDPVYICFFFYAVSRVKRTVNAGSVKDRNITGQMSVERLRYPVYRDRRCKAVSAFVRDRSAKTFGVHARVGPAASGNVTCMPEKLCAGAA